MGSAIMILFFLPWIDRSPTKSIRYRSLAFKIILFSFVIAFIGLGYLGTQPVNYWTTLFSQIFAFVYFGFFVALFLVSRFEHAKPVPERLT
jgi:ubiquinol-cytochrome c reductase cytochrome b subunit